VAELAELAEDCAKTSPLGGGVNMKGKVMAKKGDSLIALQNKANLSSHGVNFLGLAKNNLLRYFGVL
jgi:hypothetical protein